MPADLAAYHLFVSRPTRYALIALLLFSTAMTAWQFIQSVRQSDIFYADYDHLGSALWFLALCAIAIWYEVHRIMHPQSAANREPKIRWRQRIFLRAFLYCFAAMILLNVPLAVIKAEQSSHRWQAPPMFWSQLSLPEVIIPPIVAAAVVVYDRRRLQREARQDYNLCPRCGYDLRASPTRCPECGTPVSTATPETR